MSISTPTAPPAVAVVLQQAIVELARSGVPDPEVDAQLLLGHVLGVGRGRVQALAAAGSPITVADAGALDDLVARRAAREPLQHITGWAPFRSIELRVGPGVFVPRPETEVVAQIAIDALWAVATPEPVAVDLGTGSGAIALAMASEVPHARVLGVENSAPAYVWTRQNFERLGLPNARPVFVDLADALPDMDDVVDVVVSNPPYIPDDAVPRDPEVRLYDPSHALFGGADGMDIIRAVSLTALRLLHPGGLVVIEHAEQQGALVRQVLASDGWRSARTHRDLTLRDRATTAIR